MDKTLKLRLSGEELEKWRDLAEAEGMTLSAWIRIRCSGDVTQRRDYSPKQEPKKRAVPAKKFSEASPDHDALIEAAVARHTGHNVGHDCPECDRARKLLSH